MRFINIQYPVIDGVQEENYLADMCCSNQRFAQEGQLCHAQSLL